jgi:hypothetical protein
MTVVNELNPKQEQDEDEGQSVQESTDTKIKSSVEE